VAQPPAAPAVRPPRAKPCDVVSQLKFDIGKEIEIPVSLSPTQYAEIAVRGAVSLGTSQTKVDARRIYRGARPSEHRLLAVWPPQLRLFVSGGREKHEHVFGRADARVLSGKPIRVLFDIAPLKKEIPDADKVSGALTGELRRCETGEPIAGGTTQTELPIVPLVVVGASTLSLGAVGLFFLGARRRRRAAAVPLSGPLTSEYAVQLAERLRTTFDAALSAIEKAGTAAAKLVGPLNALFDAGRALLVRVDRLVALETSVDETEAGKDAALLAQLQATKKEIAGLRIRAEKVDRMLGEATSKISAATTPGGAAPLDAVSLAESLNAEARAIEGAIATNGQQQTP
jgi:hypothetical protein